MRGWREGDMVGREGGGNNTNNRSSLFHVADVRKMEKRWFRCKLRR